MASGSDKPTIATKTNTPPSTKGVTGPSKYLDQSRTLVTISTVPPTEGASYTRISVQGIIPPEYGFSIKNEFQPLLTANQAINDFQKAGNAINQLIGDTGLSVVPYSPMIWMGAQALVITELVLHFVCYDNAHNDVHKPLMDLLAMSLPQGNGGSLAGVVGGMLLAPPSVEIKIGDVIAWSPCFLDQVVVTEKAPYTKEGYGMTGEAKISIIRRDYVFSDDFRSNSKSTTVQPGREVTSTPKK